MHYLTQFKIIWLNYEQFKVTNTILIEDFLSWRFYSTLYRLSNASERQLAQFWKRYVTAIQAVIPVNNVWYSKNCSFAIRFLVFSVVGCKIYMRSSKFHRDQILCVAKVCDDKISDVFCFVQCSMFMTMIPNENA